MIPGWVAIASAVAAALAYGAGWCWQGPSALKSALKTLATVALAGAALAFGAPWPVTLGLALGAAGDLALSRPGQGAFLAGMAAFALGHLAYAAAFLAAGHGLPPLVPALAVLALGLSTELWLAPRTGALRSPVRAYVAIILAMALAALTLPATAWVTLTGAALFLVSDTLLAVEIFLLPPPSPRALHRAVWAAYWLGQALICLGAAGVLGPSL
jgi:uncharacterized membrane protein YhhN